MKCQDNNFNHFFDTSTPLKDITNGPIIEDITVCLSKCDSTSFLIIDSHRIEQQ